MPNLESRAPHAVTPAGVDAVSAESTEPPTQAENPLDRCVASKKILRRAADAQDPDHSQR